MGSNIILAIGALVIFGTFLSSSNRLMTTNGQIADQSEYSIAALSVGQSVLDEAKTKAFDQKTAGLTSSIALPDSCTAAASLGREGAEATTVPAIDTLTRASPFSALSPGYRSMDKFNDIDDYNGYKRRVNTARAERYMVSVVVSYASPTYPDSAKATQTFCKVMKITVASPFMSDSVKLFYAFNY